MATVSFIIYTMRSMDEYILVLWGFVPAFGGNEFSPQCALCIVSSNKHVTRKNPFAALGLKLI